VIDILLIVDDSLKFHESNLKLPNKSHYSTFAKFFPPRFTDYVQNTGSQIYFNPLIPLHTFKDRVDDQMKELLSKDRRRLKYGVISVQNAFDDLT